MQSVLSVGDKVPYLCIYIYIGPIREYVFLLSARNFTAEINA